MRARFARTTVVCAAVLCGAATLFGAAGLTGCSVTTAGATRTLTYTDDAKKAYEEALQAFHDKDWESARPLFEEVKKSFPQSRYSRLAELRLADIDFAQGKYSDAIAGYREYIATYRTDREVEYARYRLAKSLYFDIDDTVLLPPAEERDQGTTADSFRELRGFLRAYPKSRYKKDVDYMIEVVTGRLVRHELYVARYYRRKDNYEAAVTRIDYALKTFPNSGLDPEALVMKGETLMMMNHRDEARLAFQSVVDEWGGPFVERAKAYLTELGKPTQAPPKIIRDPDPGPLKPANKPPGTNPPDKLPQGIAPEKPGSDTKEPKKP
jgi:outer membrane protein assembly factor BamD